MTSPLTFVLTPNISCIIISHINTCTLVSYFSVNIMFHTGQPIGSGEVVTQLAIALLQHCPYEYGPCRDCLSEVGLTRGEHRGGVDEVRIQFARPTHPVQSGSLGQYYLTQFPVNTVVYRKIVPLDSLHSH